MAESSCKLETGVRIAMSTSFVEHEKVEKKAASSVSRALRLRLDTSVS